MKKITKSQRKFLREFEMEGIRYELFYQSTTRKWKFSIHKDDQDRYYAIEEGLKERYDY